MDGVSFEFGKMLLRFEGENAIPATSMFLYPEYGFLDVEGKIVLDIGAWVGDSSIYFASRGAKRVIAYEPFPIPFSCMERNIGINKMEKAIKPINAGVGAKDGTAKIDGTGIKMTNTIDGRGNDEVRILSLKTMIENDNLNNAILKLDCEGAEYDAILKSSNKTLSNFSEMAIEYDYGCESLVKKLKSAGFETEIIGKERNLFQKDWKYKNTKIGMLHAKKG
jgi:FkbM family methyltransferase